MKCYVDKNFDTFFWLNLNVVTFVPCTEKSNIVFAIWGQNYGFDSFKNIQIKKKQALIITQSNKIFVKLQKNIIF